MATYYDGNSEIEGGDGLQTLILMNPGYINYSGAEQPSLYLSSDHHHPPPPTHQFVGIPLSAPPPPLPSVHDISGLHAFGPRVQYMYNPSEMAAPPRDVTRFRQGLSLSLSSQRPGFGSHPAGDDGSGPGGGGGAGVQSVLFNSKYLKATQELLEEVVNVGKEVSTNQHQSIKNLRTVGSGGGSPAATTGEGEESGCKRGGDAELTTAEKQEIQMKKAKLVNILDEVEQRYRQYHHQMQIVISWFEQAAGMGSAKTYTALALQTISKQFRCLKDAIMGQIKVAGKSLGEDSFGGGGGKSDGGSRLRFVDNQLRQQRALQQLGMIQHNAWRPQRGLPERSVSVLRAWLFEHFLHPYPKDSDKHLLAKQTGLTRSQVSNWFINARVRLWKPMVEEMYMEEIKQQEHNAQNDGNSNSSYKHEKSASSDNSNLGYKSTKPETSINHHLPPPSTTTTEINFENPTGFMGEFRPQYSVNGVSLTLGLPHCDNRSFVANQNDEFGGINQSSSSHSAAMYESINIQNRKRFAAQLLPDFVT